MFGEIRPSHDSLFYSFHYSNAYQLGEAPYKIHEKYPQLRLAPDKLNIRDSHVKPGWYPLLCNSVVWAIEEQLVRNKVPLRYVDAVAGVPDAGNPIADLLAERIAKLTGRTVDIFRLEKEQHEDGKRRVTDQLSGTTSPRRQKVLIVDDLFSTGESANETAEALKSNDLHPLWIAGAIDRKLLGVERLRESGFTVITAADIYAFYRFSVIQGFITPEDRKNALEFITEAQEFISGRR